MISGVSVRFSLDTSARHIPQVEGVNSNQKANFNVADYITSTNEMK
ncbi:hypothetical protein [Vibrio crassostreae]|nr:hypothetical protein [Vibrio crassostreae]